MEVGWVVGNRVRVVGGGVSVVGLAVVGIAVVGLNVVGLVVVGLAVVGVLPVGLGVVGVLPVGLGVVGVLPVGPGVTTSVGNCDCDSDGEAVGTFSGIKEGVGAVVGDGVVGTAVSLTPVGLEVTGAKEGTPVASGAKVGILVPAGATVSPPTVGMPVGVLVGTRVGTIVGPKVGVAVKVVGD